MYVLDFYYIDMINNCYFMKHIKSNTKASIRIAVFRHGTHMKQGTLTLLGHMGPYPLQGALYHTQVYFTHVVRLLYGFMITTIDVRLVCWCFYYYR